MPAAPACFNRRGGRDVKNAGKEKTGSDEREGAWFRGVTLTERRINCLTHRTRIELELRDRVEHDRLGNSYESETGEVEYTCPGAHPGSAQYGQGGIGHDPCLHKTSRRSGLGVAGSDVELGRNADQSNNRGIGDIGFVDVDIQPEGCGIGAIGGCRAEPSMN